MHLAYKTVGLSSCRTIGLSDYRAVGLAIGSLRGTLKNPDCSMAMSAEHR